ncbi:hypothetical protein, partial [Pseudomonas glycinae]|uniref:hypothetical protein n=1 Tax=Pseudomonas glycinae TaxID=1785145 RepID=UPI002B1CE309
NAPAYPVSRAEFIPVRVYEQSRRFGLVPLLLKLQFESVSGFPEDGFQTTGNDMTDFFLTRSLAEQSGFLDESLCFQQVL